MSGWQAVYEDLEAQNFVIIAVAQDTQGVEAAAPWYERAQAQYVGLVDPMHRVSALYNLVNVPSAVWIDEQGRVRRIDEGTYATIHKMGEFEFGREDYAPMVADWVAQGEASEYLKPAGSLEIAQKSADEGRAEAAFVLASHFKTQGDEARAERYWAMAQKLNKDSWNYHRQDWAYTPEEAGANWQKKVETLEKPYYKPIEEIDSAEGEE